MPTDSEEGRRIAVSLVSRAGHSPNSAQVAKAIIATLQDMDIALSPIIGRKGVVALYRRSLHLCESAYPDLIGALDSTPEHVDFSRLESLLQQQTPNDALCLGNHLLETLYQLLSTLIGVSLTERLLGAVFEAPLSALPAQDTSP